MKFGAFIMTYERPKEVLKMIDCLFQQTLPPQKIVVVDNSLSHETRQLIEELNNPLVEYARVGHNAGPAGAAKAGLKKLTEEGFQWVFWGDDDDPPRTKDAFERIFAMQLKLGNQKVGALGLIGNHFLLHQVKIKIIKTENLRGILPVNSLVGNGIMIINTDVIKASIFPDERLFFGYEELDFCLRIKKGGFGIYIDGDYYRAQKEISKKEKKGRIQKVGINSRRNSLWREYYSIRNLMFIVYDKHKSVAGLILILIRVFGKILFSYSKGISFGIKYTRLACKAVGDFKNKNMGLVIQPGSI